MPSKAGDVHTIHTHLSLSFPSPLQLTSKLQATLMTHFAPDTEAGRLDKPTWLLDTVVTFMRKHAPLADTLQPSLVASGEYPPPLLLATLGP